MDVLPVAFLQWDESTLDVAEFLRYEVWRRRQGESDFVKIARIEDITQAFYTDSTIRSGEVTEYTVTQVQDFSGEEVSSDPATPQGVVMTWGKVFLHDVTNPGFYTAMPANAMTRRAVQDIGFVQPWNRRQPTAQIGNQDYETFTVMAPGIWSTDRDWWRGLRSVVSRQVNNGAMLMIRGGRDVGHFVAVVDSGRTDDPSQFDADVELTEVFYVEAVE